MIRSILTITTMGAVFAVGVSCGATYEAKNTLEKTLAVKNYYENTVVKAKDNAIELLSKELQEQNVINSRLQSTVDRLQSNLKQPIVIRQPAVVDRPKDPNEASLRECKELLSEGAGLLREGTQLLTEAATAHDAIATLISLNAKYNSDVNAVLKE